MSIKVGEDLLNVLNKGKKAEGSAATAAEPTKPKSTTNTDEGGIESDNLAAASKSQASADNGTTGSNSASEKEEPSGSSDSSAWTMDNALKEIKKLREENKSQRLKYSDKLDEFKQENDNKFVSVQEQLKEYEKYKSELDKLRTAEEDKKRSLEEKVSHRETRIAELEQRVSAEKQDAQQKLEQLEMRVKQYEADREAEIQVYKNRLDEELAIIPDKFKEVAKLLVKGAGDPRDALIALNEAKLGGLFEEKRVVVNHSVPGASDGARASKEQLENAGRTARDKMSSSQKIKEALSAIKSGNTNSAFKAR